jgi:hypothetical protein
MPGQYFAYVPFKTPGDLGGAIDAWRQTTNGMASHRRTHDILNKNLTDAHAEGKRGAITEAQEKLAEHDQRSSRDKHGEVGLDQRKVPVRLNHYDGNAPLSVLGGHQPFEYTLYVVGHCAQGSLNIFNTSPRYKETEELTVAVLVRRMIDDGLPKEIFNIKLLSCYGAVGWNDSPPFLDGFARALSAHCPRLFVRGYKEPVYLGQFYKSEVPSKKAASLPDGNLSNIKALPSTLSAYKRDMAVGLDTFPRCVLQGCGKPARFKCGSCASTFYCSKTHLQQDRTRHYPAFCTLGS